jgi:AmmeMemoRadiSam system protein B
MTSLVRYPAVAGRFYPLDPDTLTSELQTFLHQKERASPALGCIVPHAGYMYSGHVAGSVFGNLRIPSRVIILGPNHTGVGFPLAIMSAGLWETPLGRVPVDVDLAETLKERVPMLNEDSTAHRGEHAIEVELPFIQSLTNQVSFVPIALGTGNFDILAELGNSIADVVSSSASPILLIASSDMNHYENDTITRMKDHKAIEKILALDARGLHDTVVNEDISMCGFGPAVVMLTAAKKLGAITAELVKYATSADTSGDTDTVVGYAGIIVR